MSSLAAFLQHFDRSCADDTFVKLTLSSPTAAAGQVERVLGRLVDLRTGRHLSCTQREARRDTVVNVPLAEAGAWLAERLATGFRSALLATAAGDWQLRRDADGDRLIHHRQTRAVPRRTHDVAKPTLLGPAAIPWLAALGVVDAHGRPRPRLAAKHAQIDRFVEILAHLARDAGLDRAPPADAGRALRVVDVGAGKGHLTFAAWHLVHHVLGRPAEVIGVETRAELADAANALAGELTGGELRFVRGDIADAPLPGADVLVALHACNTATDHAIRRGVEAGARLIVVAPCCHQELRPQLARPEPLAPVLQHGLMAERMAEWVTDGLRALVLEHAGYRTKVIEFVGSEHTAKNVMLAAVRLDAPPDDARRAAARAAIDAFRAFFGVRHQALDALLATGDASARTAR